MTQFCSAEVPLWNGMSFFVDGNSKITASNGTFENPKPNAFSLPHISSCPGSTPTCRAACYVNNLETNAAETYAKYKLNSAALHRVLMSTESTDRSATMFADWISENCREFRWHVSGDVMHARHAQWIAAVSHQSQRPCWIYTRSFDLVPDLLNQDGSNLTVNISVDRDNYAEARARHANAGLTFNRAAIRFCYMSVDCEVPHDLPEGSVIFPDYSLRGRDIWTCGCGWVGADLIGLGTDGTPDLHCPACYSRDVHFDPTSAPWWQGLTHAQRRMTCPADFFGQSESARCGPCNKCMVKP